MLFLQLKKDGGPDSKVWGWWLIEWKRLFTVALMHFLDGSREAYHSHAFNAISWVIRGKLTENIIDGTVNVYTPSFKPIYTPRTAFHKVVSEGNTWVFTLRGPWVKVWFEYIPGKEQLLALTNGRKVLETYTKDMIEA